MSAGLPLRSLCALLLALAVVPAACAQDGYRKPPKVILDILDAAPAPLLVLSPGRDCLLLVQAERYPPIADLAQPFLGLAGLRINPRTNGPRLPPSNRSLSVQSLADNTVRPVKLPDNAHIDLPVWAPDGKTFAFLNTTATGIELWVGDPKGTARRLPGPAINAAYGTPLQWMPDNQTLLCLTVPAGRAAPPRVSSVPAGPTIHESTGKAGPVRTFQDRLHNSHDEDLFDYYVTSQLLLVDTGTGKGTPVGKPAVLASCTPSPDGKLLLVERQHRPYSYLLMARSFPKKLEVWDRAGKVVATLADLPAAERVPIGGVRRGPRGAHWKPTEPATLVWVEALDRGDPRKKVSRRDRVLTLAAPFKDKPRELARTEFRFAGLAWSAKGNLALLSDADRSRRRQRTFLLNTDKADSKPRLIWDRSIQDRYGAPGLPVMRRLPTGGRVLWQHADDIFLAGPGASPRGDRPFLDRFNLTTFKSVRLFECADGCYEAVAGLLADDGTRFLTRYETPEVPPNYYLRTAGKEERQALTAFKDPAPQLRRVKKQLVTYKRADGVPLSFTLYLPPNHKPGQRLPTLLWAYPREYADAGTAGQVIGSPYRFTTVTGPSHLFFVLRGYAILDGATMPVVGPARTANDTFIDQITSSARAAIDRAVEMGVTDRDRVGVGGHSYGAFMTANLLAHTDLFRAGIARSGAYNRTLTPFGFQNERRTLWEAPEVYLKMSPFMAANKIKTPLLLIHGAEDNNAGTFPMQSERLYQAVRGNGGTVRYVSLPHEAHGYVARESVEHTLVEMLAWFDRHVKNAPPR